MLSAVQLGEWTWRAYGRCRAARAKLSAPCTRVARATCCGCRRVRTPQRSRGHSATHRDIRRAQDEQEERTAAAPDEHAESAAAGVERAAARLPHLVLACRAVHAPILAPSPLGAAPTENYVPSGMQDGHRLCPDLPETFEA